MKRILLGLSIVIVSLMLIASVGYKYKISKDAIREAIKMRGYNFTEKNKIESKTNGFFRAVKERKFKLASNFLLDRKNIELCKHIFDRNSKYFLTIKNVEVAKNNAIVDLEIIARGENRGVVKEDSCKIIFAFSKNQWKISDINDFVDKIKDKKRIEEPLGTDKNGEEK